jgi:hypothetical protein
VRVAIPNKVVKIAEELRQLPGVVCVVWGSRKTGKRWIHEPCISVHVKKKLDPDRLGKRKLPKKIAGYRVDVIEAGAPRPHSLSVRDPVDGGNLGSSTATALAVSGNAVAALLSGHATLNAAGREVTIDADGQTFTGKVVNGGFGGGLSADWAFATFSGAAASLDPSHPATNDSSPIAFTRDLSIGDPIQHFSLERGRLVQGFFQGHVIGNVKLGNDVYTSLLSIIPKASAVPFSVPGDSGSLVVDDTLQAVGALIGGKAGVNVFYAYDLTALESMLTAARFGLFFEEA